LAWPRTPPTKQYRRIPECPSVGRKLGSVRACGVISSPPRLLLLMDFPLGTEDAALALGFDLVAPFINLAKFGKDFSTE